MRITNLQLTKPQATYVNDVTKEKDEAVNPQTKKPVSVDFSKDLFSLLKSLNPHKILKGIDDIDVEVTDGYVKKKLTDYYKVRTHYEAIRKFMREFTHTRLYQHLQSLNNPEKALEILLDMFSPPPPKNKPQKGQGQEKSDEQGKSQEQDGKGQQGQGNGQGGQSKDQDGEGNKGNGKKKQSDKDESQDEDENKDQNPNNQPQDEPEEMDNSKEDEISNNPPDPLIDLEKFKEDMPAMEEMLRNNVLEDEMMRNIVETQAGTGHNELTTVEGLSKNIKKIARCIREGNFKILDVARKFDVTEEYVREEEVKDVMYPEKDWRTTNMKNLSDVTKVLPYQFLYPNEIFEKMLIDKDLKIKQSQSRRKKKQILYILVDCSGSMCGARSQVASAIAIAYIKKAISEKSIYFFRFFDTSCMSLHRVTNEKEAIKEINFLLQNPYSGGGTDINMALKRAIRDINDPKLFKQTNEDLSLYEKNALDGDTLYERADILIITDGEDGVNVTPEELEKNKVVLHTFLIEGRNDTLVQLSKTCQTMDRSKVTNLLK